MKKLDLTTPDLTTKHIEQIGALFPQVLTEKEDEDGNIANYVRVW